MRPKDESGATAMIAAGISIAIISVVKGLGTKLKHDVFIDLVAIEMTVPLFNNNQRHYVAMIRGGAMAFVALAAVDWYFLNGEYVRAAEAVAHSLAHHLVG